MKKILFTFSMIALAIFATSCSSDDDNDDKTIPYNNLPATAQTFSQTYFADATVRQVEKDNDSYNLYYTNGFEIDFYTNGEWKSIESSYQQFPASLLTLSPIDIINADVTKRYSGLYIIEIEKDTKKNGFEVKLNNNVELIYEWDGTYRGVDIDDSDDKAMPYENLPATSKTFIETYFPNVVVAMVKDDGDNYDVYLNNGFEVEFYKDGGEWKNIDGNNQTLPTSILSLSPINLINTDVVKRYPSAFVTEIEKDTKKNGFEVKLNNKIELIYEWNGIFRAVDVG